MGCAVGTIKSYRGLFVTGDGTLILKIPIFLLKYGSVLVKFECITVFIGFV